MDLEGSRPLQGKLAIVAGTDAKAHRNKHQLPFLWWLPPTFETGPWVIQAINLSQVDNFTTTPETKFKPRTSTCKKNIFRTSPISLSSEILGSEDSWWQACDREIRNTTQPHIATSHLNPIFKPLCSHVKAWDRNSKAHADDLKLEFGNRTSSRRCNALAAAEISTSAQIT